MKEIDRITKALVKSGRVRVGFPRSTGSYDDGTKVVDVAIWNEFGTENIPPRPFMRNSIAAHKGEYKDLGRQLAKEVIKGRKTVKQGLEELGLLAASDIQDEITNLREPPLAQVTIDRKGSSKPLIDTGKLRQSVTYEVKV